MLWLLTIDMPLPDYSEHTKHRYLTELTALGLMVDGHPIKITPEIARSQWCGRREWHVIDLSVKRADVDEMSERRRLFFDATGRTIGSGTVAERRAHHTAEALAHRDVLAGKPYDVVSWIERVKTGDYQIPKDAVW